jgi:hypothetical protein
LEKISKFNPDYLQYMFASSSFNNREITVCVCVCVCDMLEANLSNDMMCPGKMIRDLYTMHPGY